MSAVPRKLIPDPIPQPCARCDYDIANLPMDAVCPECGLSVRDSRWPGPLANLIVLRRGELRVVAQSECALGACVLVVVILLSMELTPSFIAVPTLGMAFCAIISACIFGPLGGFKLLPRTLFAFSSALFALTLFAVMIVLFTNYARAEWLLRPLALLLIPTFVIRQITAAYVGAAVQRGVNTLRHAERTQPVLMFVTLCAPLIILVLSFSDDNGASLAAARLVACIYALWSALFWYARAWEMRKIEESLHASATSETRS